MVDEQLDGRGIRDPRVLAAMGAVPRHLFVDPALPTRAYGDHALPTAEGQTHLAAVDRRAHARAGAHSSPTQRVLEIGTGTGYQTALLARLASDVFSVERLASLAARRAEPARRARDRATWRCAHGDGTLGWQEFAPYARVLVAAAAPHVPEALARPARERGLARDPGGWSALPAPRGLAPRERDRLCDCSSGTASAASFR